MNQRFEGLLLIWVMPYIFPLENKDANRDISFPHYLLTNMRKCIGFLGRQEIRGLLAKVNSTPKLKFVKYSRRQGVNHF